MVKDTLRRELLQRRETLAVTERLKKDKKIKTRFLQLEEFKKAERIFFYASYRAEVDTFIIISEALRMNKKVALPKVYPKEKDMKFYWIRDVQELSPGYWGIPEPDPVEEAYPENADLIVIPAIAFDKRGYRLGYGGGYYDRFLKKVRKDAILIGLAYEEQILDIVPKDEWDIPVSLIVTEERTIRSYGH